MITREQILQVLEPHLAETNFFIVQVEVKPGNKIEITVDQDGGINIEGCTGIHRFIVSQFDREQEDYELLVTSPGVGKPLLVSRQYKNNIGRSLAVNLVGGGKHEGILLAANDDMIQLQTRTRETVPNKKNKTWVERTIDIALNQIEEAKVLISFK
jgi:ribosome maturation factor RimP